VQVFGRRQRGHHTRRNSRRPKSAKAGNRGAIGGERRAYGDFASGSENGVAGPVGDTRDLAARVGGEWRGDREMGILRWSMVVSFAVVARTSGQVRRAPAVLAADQQQQRA